MKINMIKKALLVLTISAGVAFTSKSLTKPQPAKLYATIGYLDAKNGASPERGYALSALGVLHATANGAIWGFVYGNAAGAIGGAAVGL